MNSITLIGTIAVPPVYYCTDAGLDLVRFQLLCLEPEGEPEAEIHHCQAWGPAALDLHAHLETGERLLVRGALRYRKRRIRDGISVQLSVINVREYSYLGVGTSDHCERYDQRRPFP